MSLTQDLIDWAAPYPPFASYAPSRGLYDEDASEADQKYLSIMIDGGRNPGVIEDYTHVQLIWTGPRNADGITGALAIAESEAFGFKQFVRDNYKSSCFARVKLIGDIMGPKYTEQGRPCYMMTLELIY